MESEHYLQKPYETIWLFSFIFVNHVNAYGFGEVNVSVSRGAISLGNAMLSASRGAPDTTAR